MYSRFNYTLVVYTIKGRIILTIPPYACIVAVYSNRVQGASYAGRTAAEVLDARRSVRAYRLQGVDPGQDGEAGAHTIGQARVEVAIP